MVEMSDGSNFDYVTVLSISDEDEIFTVKITDNILSIIN
jgi:hypothetical protein